MDVEDVKKLTVEKLKPELKARGLDTSGKKADLVDRLETFLKSNTAETSEQPPASTADDAGDQKDAKPAAAQGKQSIVWNPATAASLPAPEQQLAAPTDTEAKSVDELEAEKRKARAAKFGTASGQDGGKRKLETSGSDQISASDLVSEDKQAKRRERFLTQEQKEVEAEKIEVEKKRQERASRFNLNDGQTDGKKADRAQRFQQWLGPSSNTAAPAANGKPAGDKITAALNTSLDETAKLLGKGGKGRGGGKAAAAAPAQPKYTDEFKAKADARKARFAAKA